MFHACLKGCSRIFNRFFLGCFKEFSRVIKVSSMFQGSFWGVSRAFLGGFKKVLVFQECFVVEGGSKRVSMQWQFQGSLQRVSRKVPGVSW